MYLAYTDESGDDGLPGLSPLYVQSVLYFQSNHWKANFDKLVELRKSLYKEHNFDPKVEMHMRRFLYNEENFGALRLSRADKLKIITNYCEYIAQLQVKIINVVIQKPIIRKHDYPVLERALTYAIQRIENDLPQNENFLLIVDPGREGKIVATARKIRRYNPIPSKYNSNVRFKPILKMIEDPLPKDSKQSYFIQSCDVISTIVYMYMGMATGLAPLSKKLSKWMGTNEIQGWLNIMKPVINHLASSTNKYDYGIVCYPNP